MESLIERGLVGAALGALINKNDDLGVLAFAVLLATFRANENAQKTNIPVYIEQDGAIYELSGNGERKFIKRIEESNKQIPEFFKLK